MAASTCCSSHSSEGRRGWTTGRFRSGRTAGFEMWTVFPLSWTVNCEAPIGRRERLAEQKADAEPFGDHAGRLFDPHDASVGIERDEPPAHGDRGGREYLAVAQQAELAGAAADVDVEQRSASRMGEGR